MQRGILEVVSVGRKTGGRFFVLIGSPMLAAEILNFDFWVT